MTVVLQSPIMAPHKCCMCGAGAVHDDRTYVDTGIDIEFYGVVYYCSVCFGETARKLNFVTREELDEARRIVMEQTVQINELVTKIEELNGLVDSYRSVINHTPSTASANIESSSGSKTVNSTVAGKIAGKQGPAKSLTKS